VRHDLGKRGYRGRLNGECVSGPATLSEGEFGSNKIDMWDEIIRHPLIDEFHTCRTPDGRDTGLTSERASSEQRWEQARRCARCRRYTPESWLRRILWRTSEK